MEVESCGDSPPDGAFGDRCWRRARVPRWPAVGAAPRRGSLPVPEAERASCRCGFNARLLSVAAAAGAAAGARSPARATAAAFGKQRRLPGVLGWWWGVVTGWVLSLTEMGRGFV